MNLENGTEITVISNNDEKFTFVYKIFFLPTKNMYKATVLVKVSRGLLPTKISRATRAERYACTGATEQEAHDNLKRKLKKGVPFFFTIDLENENEAYYKVTPLDTHWRAKLLEATEADWV